MTGPAGRPQVGAPPPVPGVGAPPDGPLPAPGAAGPLGVVFPGQGAQTPGMGLDLARAYPLSAGRVFRTADRVSGYRLSRLIERGSPDLLARTDITQPALLTASVAAWEALRSEVPGLSPSGGAGLSLGEYGALVAAGALDFEKALTLVTWRGRLMEEAARRTPGGMAAVLGLDRAAVEGACAEAAASGAGGVWVANYNAPGQYVVTGEKPALEAASRLCLAAGGKVVPLRTSGPFHSPLMAEAGRRFSPLLELAPWRSPRFPVHSNATGLPYGATGAAGTAGTASTRSRPERASPARPEDAIPAGLAAQVSSPVLWEDCVRDMARRGVRVFVELGPGRTVTSLVSRILPEAVVLNVSDLPSLRRTAELLRPYALGVVS